MVVEISESLFADVGIKRVDLSAARERRSQDATSAYFLKYCSIQYLLRTSTSRVSAATSLRTGAAGVRPCAGGGRWWLLGRGG